MPSAKRTITGPREVIHGAFPADRAVDQVATEEPLEIRVAGDAVSITMRTPGHDRELAVGFLFSEGVIRSIDDVGSVAHCGRPDDDGFGNVIDVLPGPGVALAPECILGARRGTLTTSACGVCGRLSIDDLKARCQPVTDSSTIHRPELEPMFDSMRAAQRVFAETGGTHAAALFDLAGGEPIVREDIGRHNAVDKVVGAMLLGRRPLGIGRVLTVSGRASFEIVQKAAVARIPIVASVSAASTLAVDLADAMNITLAAFVRGQKTSVYTHARRILF
jgi:FdhD protein